MRKRKIVAVDGVADWMWHVCNVGCEEEMPATKLHTRNYYFEEHCLWLAYGLRPMFYTNIAPPCAKEK